jgi:CRISPR-associated protein Cmr6
MQACRDRLRDARNHEKVAHAGLILARYLSVPAGDTELPREKHDLFRAARRANANSLDLYRQAFQQRERWLESLKARSRETSTSQGGPRGPLVEVFSLITPPDQRLIVGLGSDSPLETGLTLHRTYGTPILPGSGLKGLAAHYCDQVVGEHDPRFKRSRGDGVGDRAGKVAPAPGPYEVLFGAGDSAGFITFHDAWIAIESLSKCDEGLLDDIMTPHHGDYYGGKQYSGGPMRGQLVPPTDFDGPVPVQFLSIRGAFHFVLTCDDADATGRRYLEFARDLLIAALRDWGIGGKTSSGYGRLVSTAPKTGDQSPHAASAPAAKRAQNTPCKVLIVATRAKGGFDVQESGRRPGTLTLGTPPPGTSTNLGDEVDVVIHNDEPKCPQYRWPDLKASQPKSGPPKKPPKDFRR